MARLVWAALAAVVCAAALAHAGPGGQGSVDGGEDGSGHGAGSSTTPSASTATDDGSGDSSSTVTPASVCQLVDCFGHGECQPGTGACKCHAGFSGDSCRLSSFAEIHLAFREKYTAIFPNSKDSGEMQELQALLVERLAALLLVTTDSVRNVRPIHEADTLAFIVLVPSKLAFDAEHAMTSGTFTLEWTSEGLEELSVEPSSVCILHDLETSCPATPDAPGSKDTTYIYVGLGGCLFVLALIGLSLARFRHARKKQHAYIRLQAFDDEEVESGLEDLVFDDDELSKVLQ